ncbi:hypothetical protein Tco_1566741 [Tanacetum coccineum]
MSTVMTSRFPSTNNQIRNSSNPRNQATIQDGRVSVQQVQGRQGLSFAGTGTKGNATGSIRNNVADAYDSDCDDISSAKSILMANVSSYSSDVLSKLPHSDIYQNDMVNQSVQEIDEVFLALGWHLEEIHVTWAHLEKKRTRLLLYTENHEELFT